MTHKVLVRDVAIGGGAKISIQSMTNTDTRDADATIAQILELEAAGCDIVRFTVNDKEAAKSIPRIREKTHIPLVADIHYDARLALLSIENGIDKVRFNPGNIGSASKVAVLTRCARLHSVPIRIGVNAGSLEKALLQKYGSPTPDALIESALLHVKLLEAQGFYDIVISIKTSSVRDTVIAYRKLSSLVDYPLHIGVTEAGYGEMALIKSSAALGSLLIDGIGDTLRISMTGDPIAEVHAARKLLSALRLYNDGIEIISCPTCGRTTGDHLATVKAIEKKLSHIKKPLKVAIMGCVVNGIGEGREADIGIAFAPNGAVVFKSGTVVFSGSREEAIAALIEHANEL